MEQLSKSIAKDFSVRSRIVKKKERFNCAYNIAERKLFLKEEKKDLEEKSFDLEAKYRDEKSKEEKKKRVNERG